MYSPWVNRTQSGHRSNMSTNQSVVLHYIRIQSQTYMQETWKKQNKTKRQAGPGVTAKKRNPGRTQIVGEGMKKRRVGEGKKNPLILPSQQTASGVPDRQFHWAGEVEHCSVSDLHSVYYAVTGAPRPRGGLLNCNMH